MALNVDCEVLGDDGQWAPETIWEALAKRSQKGPERRRCAACKEETLVANKEGRDGKAADFEHRPWNKNCPRRDQSWEEECSVYEVLKGAGSTKEDARDKVKLLRKHARSRGANFSGLNKRFRAVGILREDFLRRLTEHPDGLIAEIERREMQQ